MRGITAADYQGSELEFSLLAQLVDSGLPEPVRERRFHPERRWRFDFAWIDQRIAAEIEGGTFRRSRHTSGEGFHNDCEKYNAATLASWRVFRFDSRMIHSGYAINTLTNALTPNCNTIKFHS